MMLLHASRPLTAMPASVMRRGSVGVVEDGHRSIVSGARRRRQRVDATLEDGTSEVRASSALRCFSDTAPVASARVPARN
jgi:hypothetical protein